MFYLWFCAPCEAWKYPWGTFSVGESLSLKYIEQILTRMTKIKILRKKANNIISKKYESIPIIIFLIIYRSR